jgi:hypothetical protein
VIFKSAVELNAEAGCDVHGLFTTAYEIQINADDPERVQIETFCHEVVEGWNVILELGLTHPTIQRLGALMHQLLTSNSQ